MSKVSFHIRECQHAIHLHQLEADWKPIVAKGCIRTVILSIDQTTPANSFHGKRTPNTRYTPDLYCILASQDDILFNK